MSLTMGCYYGRSADLLVMVCVSAFLFRITHSRLRIPFSRLAGSAAFFCIGGLDVIQKEAWPFYKTSSGVRLSWELEEPQGRKG